MAESVRFRFSWDAHGSLTIGEARKVLFYRQVQKEQSAGSLVLCESAGRQRAELKEDLQWLGIGLQAEAVSLDEGEICQACAARLLSAKCAYQDEKTRELRFSLPDSSETILLLDQTGAPTSFYRAAVLDGRCQISHVIWEENSVDMLQAYRSLMMALGFPVPEIRFLSPLAELPLGVMESAVSYREKGYLPEALGDYLIALGPCKREPSKGVPVSFDWAAFQAAAKQHMAGVRPERVAILAIPQLVARGIITERLSIPEMRRMVAFIRRIQGGLACASQAIDELEVFLNDPQGTEKAVSEGILQR